MTDYSKIADQASKILVASKSQGWRDQPSKSDHDRIVGAVQKIATQLGFRLLK